VLIGLLTLLLLGTSTGAVGLVFGIVLAVLPLPIYMLLALWIDRFEKEPVWMLVAAFLWGATVSVFFAFILNTTFGVVAASVIGDGADMATTVLSAPFVEELAKGFALLIFYLWKRDEFDNVLDGIIYATMVGLGFAMTENILYYGNSLAAGGLGASMVTFILRGVVSPFAHPLFTSMTGIGLGLARLAPKGSPMKFFGPVVGLGMAMFLHFLWNFSASFGAMFFIAYVVIMVPAFLGLIRSSPSRCAKKDASFASTFCRNSAAACCRRWSTMRSPRCAGEWAARGGLLALVGARNAKRGCVCKMLRASSRFTAGARRAGFFRAAKRPPRAKPAISRNSIRSLRSSGGSRYRSEAAAGAFRRCRPRQLRQLPSRRRSHVHHAAVAFSAPRLRLGRSAAWASSP
jgi:RsiW-degrading membrane proteinase PrsW (M82 family)